MVHVIVECATFNVHFRAFEGKTTCGQKESTMSLTPVEVGDGDRIQVAFVILFLAISSTVCAPPPCTPGSPTSPMPRSLQYVFAILVMYCCSNYFWFYFALENQYDLDPPASLPKETNKFDCLDTAWQERLIKPLAED
jgi:hypothetical protein